MDKEFGNVVSNKSPWRICHLRSVIMTISRKPPYSDKTSMSSHFISSAMSHNPAPLDQLVH
jgi:hypothetical protein